MWSQFVDAMNPVEAIQASIQSEQEGDAPDNNA